ncbi:MAG: type II toxin-antitoxin system VapC family toxin [Chloroflexi bacterium]|nr:type II toxin-antitoxin system VapC family toxin [Chloroflexota bacterium]
MIFADTSALFASLISDDPHHVHASEVEALIRQQREAVWTIDPVLTELWLILRRKFSVHMCDQIVEGLTRRGIQVEGAGAADYARAWDIGRQWPDQEFSLTDRQAFAAMERTGRLRAWSYDDDFAVIRLGPARNRALQLVR